MLFVQCLSFTYWVIENVCLPRKKKLHPQRLSHARFPDILSKGKMLQTTCHRFNRPIFHYRESNYCLSVRFTRKKLTSTGKAVTLCNIQAILPLTGSLLSVIKFILGEFCLRIPNRTIAHHSIQQFNHHEVSSCCCFFGKSF